MPSNESAGRRGCFDLEELADKDIERIRTNYRKLAALARNDLRTGKLDTEPPEVNK